ncbi:MAG: hypothetical protein WCG73_00340 [Candidatus Moraniibacteriota bacterium]
MSFFSNKNTTDPKKIIEETKISPAIQTMRDDLEYLKNHKEENATSSNGSKEQPKAAPLSKSSISPMPLSPEKQVSNPFDKIEERAHESKEQPKEVIVSKPPISFAPLSPEKQVSNSFNKAGEHVFLKGINGVEKEVIAFPKPKVALPEQKDIQKKSTPIVLKASPESKQSPEKGNLLLIIGIVLITLSLISGGVYYYFFVIKKNSVPQVVPEQIVEPTQPEEVTPVEVVPPKESPYSIDKPNYLSVNIETTSEGEILKTFTTVADRIKEAGIEVPVEFLITDQNNNPLAFNRFALLLKLGLSSSVLSHIDEKFSLYMFNDSGSMRIGMNLGIDDQEKVLPILSKIESTLPSAFQPLLLEPGVVAPKMITFRSNIFSRQSSSQQKIEHALRYANIDIAKKVSIDYAIVGNHWYIGTSRNTLTALLTRIVE